MAISGEATIAIIGLAGIIVGSLITAFLVPRVRFQFELNRIYLAPFGKWCADFHGELDEFWERHFSSTVTKNTYSNVQFIDEWRALHEIAMDGPKWLAKVKNEEKKKKNAAKVAVRLGKLLSITDRVWHELEERYNVRLRDRFDIISLGEVKRRKMADTLWNNRSNVSAQISDEDIKTILTYLGKQIP